MSNTVVKFKNILYDIIDKGTIGNGWKYIEVINKKSDFSLPQCLYYKGETMKNLLNYTDYINHLDMGQGNIDNFVRDIFRDCYPGSTNPICRVKESMMIGGENSDDEPEGKKTEDGETDDDAPTPDEEGDKTAEYRFVNDLYIEEENKRKGEGLNVVKRLFKAAVKKIAKNLETQPAASTNDTSSEEVDAGWTGDDPSTTSTGKDDGLTEGAGGEGTKKSDTDETQSTEEADEPAEDDGLTEGAGGEGTEKSGTDETQSTEEADEPTEKAAAPAEAAAKEEEEDVIETGKGEGEEREREREKKKI